MRKPFYLNSLLLGVLLLLSNTIRADSIQKIVVNNPACDSIFLSNGKVIAVKNLEITSKELSFSYCNDTTDQRHRAPLQQIQKIKKADGSWLDGNYQPAQTAEAGESTEDLDPLSAQVNRLFLLSLVGLFPLPFVTQILIFRQAKKLRKQLHTSPAQPTLLHKLNLLIALNVLTLLFWIYLFILLIPFFQVLWWFVTAIIHDSF
jgi:hypothetical protein